MSPVDAWRLARKGRIVLVDVREPREIARSGKCEGALKVPLASIRQRADEKSPDHDPVFDRAKSYVLYCENGARSRMAARTMKKLGYDKVYNLGAFREWQGAGLPVER
ncbi:rhodanese-like domain-containing protein [Rhodovulum bhavnagarense]|nr:rhodanese-like domain-containing protein [Rhodovulum bhavnagarense]